MKCVLAPAWELSDEHPTSVGQAVLVHRHTGQVYGPADIVQVYPSYGFLPAAQAVARFASRPG